MWFKVISLILFASVTSADNNINTIDLIPTLNTSAMANLVVPDDWVLFSYGPKGHKIREEVIVRHEKISDIDPFTVIVGFIVENHQNKYIVRSYAGSEQGIKEVGIKKVDSTFNLNAEDLAEEFSFIDEEDEDKEENENEEDENQRPVFVNKKPQIENKPIVETIPVIEKIEPMVVENHEPVVEKIEPAADKLVLTINNADPVVENHEPVVENIEPIAVKEAVPIIDKVEPVIEHNEPIVVNVNPTVEKIQPLNDNSKTVAINIEPVVENHELIDKVQ